jgi:hypothetical protein
MMHEIFYATIGSKIDPRRRKEVADSRMIQEDHSAIANLPREGFQREFKSRNMNRSPWSDDEIGGML